MSQHLRRFFRACTEVTLSAWLIVFVFVGCTIYLGWFAERSDSGALLAVMVLFFATYLFAMLWETAPPALSFFIGIGILLRVLLLPSIPLLSDDVYRFLWDGHLLAAGINPFAELPRHYADTGFSIAGLTPDLFQRLNSPDYYTVYPPVAQWVNRLAVTIFPENIRGGAAVIRSVIVLCEVGNIYLILRLLRRFDLSSRVVLLYALNPLVIVELTGNLHFEAVLIFFFLSTIYLLSSGRKWFFAAFTMALSIASKLLPLLFFPLLIRRLGWKKFTTWAVVCGLICGLLFYPFVGGLLSQNFGQSLDLYFRKFEFNASLYYLARAVGYWKTGYNQIAEIGPALAVVSTSIILLIAVLEKKPDWRNFPCAALFAICAYLLCTTTVHPWYCALPLVLCLFTRYRFPILWSGLIWLTYLGYTADSYAENLLWTTVEYLAVIGYALWEIFVARRHDDVRYG